MIPAKRVVIDRSCLTHSILPSALEEYHKEVSGYLIAQKGRGLRIISAYPILTDIKKRTYVEHGNESAVKRIDRVMRTLEAPVIGGYHSHPDGPHKPSKTDISFVQDKLKAHPFKQWLELIVSVKRTEYRRARKIGWDLHRSKGRLGLTITPTPWTVFNVLLSGFWISAEGKVTEASLSTHAWPSA